MPEADLTLSRRGSGEGERRTRAAVWGQHLVGGGVGAGVGGRVIADRRTGCARLGDRIRTADVEGHRSCRDRLHARCVTSGRRSVALRDAGPGDRELELIGWRQSADDILADCHALVEAARQVGLGPASVTGVVESAWPVTGSI